LDKRQQSQGKESPKEALEDSPNGRSSVLLVDDDALIRMSTAQMLEELGHRVRDVTLAGDALAILRGDAEIDVLVVDVTLPDMNGVDMVKQASTFRSDLRVLFATGHNASMIDLDLSKINYVVLSKPYDTRQLAAALSKLGV
jgi:CheY-like chemotaxis protein